jgi:heat shock protein HslJ
LLDSGNWVVVFINGDTQIPEGTFISFNLEEGKVTGNAGCNNFFGSLKINKDVMVINQTGSTRRMCPDMKMEDLFFINIAKVKYFSLQNETLNLQSENRDIIFRLKKMEGTNTLD